jgi:Uma2 family endonuclease
MSTLQVTSVLTNGYHPAVPRDFIWRLSVEQYHQMIDQEILTDADAVELLEGWLVQKMPKKPAHRLVTRRTRKALEKLLPTGWFVDCQEPVTLLDSEPEPDLSVVRGDEETFITRHPLAHEIGLLVEVSDTTLRRDQGVKKRVYARARVPLYWIINIPKRRVEVYGEPSGPTKRPVYRTREEYSPGQAVPVMLDGERVGQVAVTMLLG